MAYTISLSNGTSLLGSTGLPDGTINTTSTSLSLIGKNYPGYGVFMMENFVKLLENFANDSAPSNALPGQIWFDNTAGNKVLKLNVSATIGTTQWKALAGITSGATKPNAGANPISPVVGEFWWDTANGQLKVYSGLLTQGDAGWITIGPASNTTTGQSGAQPDSVLDVNNTPHVVIKFYVSNKVYAILATETFIPASSIDDFGTQTIYPGLNITNQLQYHGNANVAMNLMVNGSAISADNFARTDVVTTSTVPIVTSNISGMSIGPNSDFVVNVTPSTSTIGVYNTDNNFDTVFYVKTGGVTTPVLKANGAIGAMQVYNDPTTGLGVASKQYVDQANTAVSTYFLKRDGTNTITGSIVPSANVTYNLGSSTAWFNVTYGKSFQAQYADLAERFHADAEYPAGTVVEMGGLNEITSVKDELSENVFGVISTGAAYIMNAEAGSDKTHPAVALSGRVPVQVIGPVKKGARLVSAGNGCARASNPGEITPFNVIGRALVDKATSDQGIIQAIVRINI